MRHFAVRFSAALLLVVFSGITKVSAQSENSTQTRPETTPALNAADSPTENPLRNPAPQDASEASQPAPTPGIQMPSRRDRPQRYDNRRYAETSGASGGTRDTRATDPVRSPAPMAVPQAEERPRGDSRYDTEVPPRREEPARADAPSQPAPRYATEIPDRRARLGASPVAPFAGAPNPTVAEHTPSQGRPNLLPDGNARLADRPPRLTAPGAPRNTAVQEANYRTVDADAGSTGTAKPGDPQLEGEQAPHLVVKKEAPEEVQVGKTAVFRTTVRNTGKITAHEVEIHDLVPQGMRLVGTNPEAKYGIGGEIVWALGRLRPGDEQTVEAHFMPVAEGELGSVATVQFQAVASAKTRVTKPLLHLETKLPEAVLIGQEAQVSIVVSNPGTGVATGVVIEEVVPQGFEHEAGHHLEQEIGTLGPGESRTIDLTLKAIQPGSAENRLTARGDGGLFTEDNRPITVVSPALDIALEGPGRRYLEREATYKVAISNPGTAPAQQVELVAYLPQGMKFVKADNAGQYDERTRTVRWNLEELPAREGGEVALTAMPIEPGPQKLRVSGAARLVPPVEKEQPILVEGIAAILFEVADVVDPIEVGGETTYRIRVVNQGTKAATDVEVACILPPGMQFVTAEGPTTHRQSANQVSFEALPQLGAKAETTYRIRVRGTRSGDQRMKVLLQTGQMQTPVTKEESTRVYSDQ